MVLDFQPFIKPTNIEEIKLPSVLIEAQKIDLPEVEISDGITIEQTDVGGAQYQRVLDQIELDRLIEKKSMGGGDKKPYSRRQLTEFAQQLGIPKSLSKAELVKRIRIFKNKQMKTNK